MTGEEGLGTLPVFSAVSHLPGTLQAQVLPERVGSDVKHAYDEALRLRVQFFFSFWATSSVCLLISFSVNF